MFSSEYKIIFNDFCNDNLFSKEKIENFKKFYLEIFDCCSHLYFFNNLTYCLLSNSTEGIVDENDRILLNNLLTFINEEYEQAENEVEFKKKIVTISNVTKFFMDNHLLIKKTEIENQYSFDIPIIISNYNYEILSKQIISNIYRKFNFNHKFAKSKDLTKVDLEFLLEYIKTNSILKKQTVTNIVEAIRQLIGIKITRSNFYNLCDKLNIDVTKFVN